MRKLILPPECAEATLENAELDLAGGPYTVRSAGAIMSMPRREQTFVFPTIPVGEHGASALIAGEPGLGKSRFVLQAAAAQCAGLGSFCGIPLDAKPRRTLVLQSENALSRVQKDLEPFYAPGFLTDAQRGALDENLMTTTLETDMDGDISIDDQHPEDGGNYKRIVKLLEETKPEVILVDPWAAVCPDELSAKAIRTTFIALRHACKNAGCGPVTIVLICHAKPGIEARASARGADAISYARGNRNLVGIVRSVVNVRPCEWVPDEPTDARADGSGGGGIRKGMEIIWVKSNNGILPPPVAVHLDLDTFRYERIADFNHAAWQETLERMVKSRQTQTPAAKAAEAAATCTTTQSRVENLLAKSGPLGKAALAGKMIELGIASSKRNAAEMITRLCDNGQLVMHQPKPNRAARYYTPAQAQEQNLAR